MTFEKQYISFSETNSFSELVTDYIEGKEKLKPFYNFPLSLEGFAAAIAARPNYSTDRSTLTTALLQQYKTLSAAGKYETVIKNIELINDPKTYTVTTGHQLNIFTGPLYFIYKIISAVKLAAELKKNFPENNFVPVYWMANEDHDFEEISYIHLFDKKISWQQEQKGASGAISTSSFHSVLEEFKNIIGEGSNTENLIRIFSEGYAQNPNLTPAMRFIVHQLFGKYGLVIIDSSDVTLKNLFKPILQKELEESFSYQQVTRTTEQLNELYKTQVNPREINLFYMIDNLRERIEVKDNRYYIHNTQLSFSKAEILAELDQHPERFSPNVVLRPLYESLILPDIAYIGGGAEISYWMQYKAMFETQQVFFPVLVLRDSAMLIDKSTAKKIKATGLTVNELFLSYDETAKIVLQKNNLNLSLTEETQAIENLFNSIAEKSVAADQTLQHAAMAEKQKAINALKGLEDKMLKAIKRKNETTLSQIKSIKDKLFPGNMLQERYNNFSMYYVKYGDQFFDDLLDAFNPLNKKFVILTETDQSA